MKGDVPRHHSLRPRFRIVRDDGEIVLGPGKAALLEAIARTGSIRSAAEELEMSYMRAWNLVKTMNEAFRGPLVEKERGGTGKGGAQLTERGQTVLRLYQKLLQKALRATEGVWEELEEELLGDG